MPTLAAGHVVSILWPTDGQITITPGSAGRVSLNARGRDGSQSIAPREIYNAETINVSAGDTVILEAINTDATYTSPVSGGGEVTAASVQAALADDPAGARAAAGLGSAATEPAAAFAAAADSSPVVADWAALQALSVSDGAMRRTAAPLWPDGTPYLQWLRVGGVWRLAAPQDLSLELSPVTGVAGGAEQILRDIALPPGLLTALRRIEIAGNIGKSGTSETLTARVRLGNGASAATTDTQIVSSANLTGTNRQITLHHIGYMTSATNWRWWHNGTAGYGGNSPSGVAYPQNITVPSAASALRLSVTLQMSGASETPTLAGLFIRGS